MKNQQYVLDLQKSISNWEIEIPTTYTEILKSHLSDKEIVELITFITFTNAQQQFGAMMN